MAAATGKTYTSYRGSRIFLRTWHTASTDLTRQQHQRPLSAIGSDDADTAPYPRGGTRPRNTTHGFNANAEILAEHSGRLPAGTVAPIVYVLDIVTDRQRLLEHIQRTCR